MGNLPAWGAPGDVDTRFHHGEGHVKFLVKKVVGQADGKVLIGGNFIAVRGAARNRIARLNRDGTVDMTFDPGTGPDKDVSAIAVQEDGKILIGGQFTSFNGVARNRLARLSPGGQLETTFAAGLNGEVLAIAIQPDGKVLAGGIFTMAGGVQRPRLVRLNANGTLDTGFNVGSGPSSTVHTIAVQADGKILIGGVFQNVNGTRRANLARLMTNGTLDTNFNLGTGPNSAVWNIALQEDQKIMLAGAFENINGTTRNRVARLLEDGTLDGSFNPGLGPDMAVPALELQEDGKILIAGTFRTVRGIDQVNIARLNPNGTLDTTFKSEVGADGPVSAMAVLADGKVALAGTFGEFDGKIRNRVVVLENDGKVDESFVPGTGLNLDVNTVAVQEDERVIIGGDFTAISETRRNRIARLHKDGTLDESFDPGSGADDYVATAVLQPDGKILIGGTFGFVNGVWRSRIARLNADGSVDRSFDPGTGADWGISAMVVQPDGRIIIGGGFNVYNGPLRNKIARIFTDGKLDQSFLPVGPNDAIHTMVLQEDGKLLVGGSFTFFNEPNVNRVARLQEDGSLDPDFHAGSGANDFVYDIAVQKDGKILVGGNFTAFDGVGSMRVARLNRDGRLDESFKVGSGANSWVNSILVQEDGRIIIGGNFTNVAGQARNRVARLNADGTLDGTFRPAGANGGVFEIAQQGNGKVLMAGGFSEVNGLSRPYLARVFVEPSPVPLFISRAGDELEVSWSDNSFHLEEAGMVTEIFREVTRSSPYRFSPTNQMQLFRLVAP